MTVKCESLEAFVRIDDRDGFRYAIRPAAVDAVADASETETVFYLRGGQSVRVKLKLDEVTTWLWSCWQPDGEVPESDSEAG